MFSVEQTYSLKALTAMCRAARKTAKLPAKLLRGVCWLIFALGLTVWVDLLLSHHGKGEKLFYIMSASLGIMLLLLLFEDRLNAWIMRRQMYPGTARSVTVFADNGYTVTMDTLQTRYRYVNIEKLVETDRYFFFFLGRRYAQIFEKACFEEGDPVAFRRYIEHRTGMTFRRIR